MHSLGEHILVDYYDCDAATLKHSRQVQKLVVQAVREAHGTVVKQVFHNFSPHGVSGVVVIAESHVTIHTWPEHRYAAIDIFSCSPKLDKKLIRARLKESFGATRVSTRSFKRGLLRRHAPKQT